MSALSSVVNTILKIQQTLTTFAKSSVIVYIKPEVAQKLDFWQAFCLFFLILKEFLKSVYNCLSYRQKTAHMVFFDSQCISSSPG